MYWSQVKMKRHNKKRNTAFLYETLVVELTKSIVQKNQKRKKAQIKISQVAQEKKVVKSLFQKKC